MPLVYFILLVYLVGVLHAQSSDNVQGGLNFGKKWGGVSGKYVRKISGLYTGISFKVEGEWSFTDVEPQYLAERYSVGIPIDHKIIMNYGYFELSSGLSVTKFDLKKNEGYGGREEYSFGIPLEFGLGLRYKYLGAGYALGYELNSFESSGFLGARVWTLF